MLAGCSALLRLVLLTCVVALPLCAQDPEDDYEALLQDAQQELQRGELRSSERLFEEILDGEAEARPEDRPAADTALSARAGLLAIGLRRGDYAATIAGVDGLDEAAQRRRDMVLLRAMAWRATGNYEAAAAAFEARIAVDPGDFEARWRLGDARWAMGQRQAAREIWRAAAAMATPAAPEAMAWRARCRARLGEPQDLVAASGELVAALGMQKDLPAARIELGVLRFAVYGEASGYPSGERDLQKVLELHGDVEEALLWLYRLRSSNFQLDGGKTERYLDRALAQNPRSVPALVLRGARVLDDRRYRDAARILDEALAIDPRDQSALCHRAAAAFALHDEAGGRAFRERAQAGDPGQSDVDRILGEHLVALYRFGDSIVHFERALASDPRDVAALHGLAKAFVYTGQGARAKEALLRAKGLQSGFVDPWRNNALAVQQLLDEEYVRVDNGPFTALFHRDDQLVLQEYLMPLCMEALATLGAKYDYQPDGPVMVEVFHTWDDFSVRTIGYRGFTALGACFGPFLTMVSPGDRDLRRQDFMWEATLWHEYAHVLTLGLSQHRVPRWLTEGFSVHEEGQRNRTFERGMDRELFDAFHNGDIPPTRLLNRLFRGERILFGYYQGGLLVDLIRRDFGFDKAVSLLRAFGQDLDHEEAVTSALGISSAELDKRLLDYVEREKLRGMRLVPRHDDAAVHRLLMRIAKDPDDCDARVQVAWAFIQRDNPVDAGPHLAHALAQDPKDGKALLCRAELLRRRQSQEAFDCWRDGFAAGADDFDSRIAYGRALQQQGELAAAAEQFRRAKVCWPNCTEQENAPELLLAAILREQGEEDAARLELAAFCARTARAYAPRWELAQHARQIGDRAEEVRLLLECNRIDPFRRELHVLLGEGFEALGKRAEAALEYEVAAAVQPALDRRWLQRPEARPPADEPGERQERGQLLLRAARLRAELGDLERARQLAARVGSELPGTPAAEEAEGLIQEWRAR